jgi:hypothetical protein
LHQNIRFDLQKERENISSQVPYTMSLDFTFRKIQMMKIGPLKLNIAGKDINITALKISKCFI